MSRLAFGPRLVARTSIPSGFAARLQTLNLVLLAIVLGLGLRSYHYLRCPAVWHDEAALIICVLKVPFAEMLGPLPNAEAAPPLFLALERVVMLTLGDSEYALRLIPFLASCLSLGLFAGLCCRLFNPIGAALAVGLFAVSDRLLWHACEAKPYALDVLAATAAAYWFVRSERTSLWSRCWPLIAAAPLAIWLSYPACFVAGGLLLGLLPTALRRGEPWTGQAAYLILSLAVGGSFLALAMGPAAAQRCEAMDGCWLGHFPKWDRPWTIPSWAILGTFEVARYNLMPLGQVALLFAAIGTWAFWHSGPDGKARVLALSAPLFLALVAACLHKYPYGGTRLEVFAAPSLCLLAAAGLRHSWPFLASRSRPLAGLAVLLMLVPAMWTAYRAVQPWHRAACDEAAAFVLAHKSATDRIVMNHWEYEYYLRKEPTGWRYWYGTYEPTDLPDAGQLWVIDTFDPPVSQFPYPLPAGWTVGEQWSFRCTTVFRLERVANP